MRKKVRLLYLDKPSDTCSHQPPLVFCLTVLCYLRLWALQARMCVSFDKTKIQSEGTKARPKRQRGRESSLTPPLYGKEEKKTNKTRQGLRTWPVAWTLETTQWASNWNATHAMCEKALLPSPVGRVIVDEVPRKKENRIWAQWEP